MKKVFKSLPLWIMLHGMSLYAEESTLPDTNFRGDEEKEGAETAEYGVKDTYNTLLYKYFFEVRPSWNPLYKTYSFMNFFEAGFKWQEYQRISYVQFFNSEEYLYKQLGEFVRNPVISYKEGFIRWKIKSVWSNSPFSLSLQNRFYLPTNSATSSDASDIQQGMIFSTRHYANLRFKINEFMDISGSYAPNFYFYKSSGYEYKNKKSANPVFAHLWTLTASVDFTKTLHLYIPMSFSMKKMRNYNDKADRNDQWKDKMTLQPQLDWWVTQRQTLGLAYISDNLIQSDGRKMMWKEGMEKGYFQLVWNLRFKHH